MSIVAAVGQVATPTLVPAHRVPPAANSMTLPAGGLPGDAGSPTLLVNETEALPVLEQALKGAKSVIDMSMFSWLDSGSGAQVAQILEQKAREGVEVDVTVDDTGCLLFPFSRRNEMFAQLKAAGVHVIHNTSYNLFSHEPVDHRKLYVIDGTQAFVGGMNLSQTYDSWHDAMSSFGGASALQAGQQFLAGWTAHGGVVSPRQKALMYPAPPGAADPTTEVLSNHPHGDEQITKAYLGDIQSATQRVWVESPVISSQMMATALESAAKRGVDVRLVISGKDSEHGIPGLSLISRTYYSELLAAGVKVYEQADMSHTKVLLSDNTAVIGSLNLTNRSAAHDAEIDLQSTATPFVASVQNMFQIDMSGGRPVSSSGLGGFENALLRGVHNLFHLQY